MARDRRTTTHLSNLACRDYRIEKTTGPMLFRNVIKGKQNSEGKAAVKDNRGVCLAFSFHAVPFRHKPVWDTRSGNDKAVLFLDPILQLATFTRCCQTLNLY